MHFKACTCSMRVHHIFVCIFMYINVLVYHFGIGSFFTSSGLSVQEDASLVP